MHPNDYCISFQMHWNNVPTIFLHFIIDLNPKLTNSSIVAVDYMINSISFVIYYFKALTLSYWIDFTPWNLR